ncbi:MAG: polysaccharide biosynthesis protein [Oscillospiraceae bacterium]|nr:polysaccharide biosynthesis protein [Oscillospiraceae bacterium]
MAEAKKQNFMYGAAILAAGVVIMKILGMLYKVPLQNILGDTGYGYFNAAYSVYNVLLTVSTAGLPVALSRMISEANTLERPRQAQRTFRIALVVLTALGALLSLLMFLFPTDMAVLMVHQPAVSQCIYALSPAVLLVCVTSAFRGYIQGCGNMTPTTVSQVLEVLVKVIVGLALAVWMTRQHRSLPQSSAGAIFGVTAGSLAALLYILLYYLRHYRAAGTEAARLVGDTPEDVGRTLAMFVKIGVVITLGASVMSLISLIDTNLIERQLPQVPGIGPALANELYGCYSAVQTLYNLPASFITPMTISVVPAIAAAAAQRDAREVGNISESGLRISAVVAIPMGVGLGVLSDPIVGILYPRTNPAGPTLLSLLSIASVFVCIALVTNAILQASGDERMPIFSMIVGGAVKIGANLLLVGRPEINILGAALGTVACYVVICVMNCVFIYRRLEVKPSYARAFLRPLLSAAVMGVSAWAVYGLLSRLLRVPSFAAMSALRAHGESVARLPMLLAMVVSIGVAVVVYLVMVIVTHSVTMEDMKLIPKGEKIARILHIR